MEREVDHDELLRRHHIGALILVRVFFLRFFPPMLMCNSSVLKQEFVAGMFSRPPILMVAFFFDHMHSVASLWCSPGLIAGSFYLDSKSLVATTLSKIVTYSPPYLYMVQHTLVSITYHILRLAFNIQNPQSCAIFHGCTYRGMAQLPAKGNFKMYHTNMTSTFLVAFLRLKDETSWRAMGRSWWDDVYKFYTL